MRNRMVKLWLFIVAAFIISGCADIQQRGMLNQTYVSTTRPAISISVPDMPLLASGKGICNLEWTGMLGGLPVHLWLAIYGTGGLAPLAITAQAQIPEDWYFNSPTPPFGAVDESQEVFDGTTYYAWTYIVNPEQDAFGGLVTGTKSDGQPQLWLVRSYTARYNFNMDKIIMQYREPLPEGIVSLQNLPLGQGELLAQFSERARNVFKVGPAPKNPQNIETSYIQGIRFQYMGQEFLGSVTQEQRLNNF